jgi:hypothetical protein
VIVGGPLGQGEGDAASFDLSSDRSFVVARTAVIGALQPVADDAAYGRRCPEAAVRTGGQERLCRVVSCRSSSVIGYGLC